MLAASMSVPFNQLVIMGNTEHVSWFHVILYLKQESGLYWSRIPILYYLEPLALMQTFIIIIIIKFNYMKSGKKQIYVGPCELSIFSSVIKKCTVLQDWHHIRSIYNFMHCGIVIHHRNTPRRTDYSQPTRGLRAYIQNMSISILNYLRPMIIINK